MTDYWFCALSPVAENTGRGLRADRLEGAGG